MLVVVIIMGLRSRVVGGREHAQGGERQGKMAAHVLNKAQCSAGNCGSAAARLHDAMPVADYALPPK